MSAGTPRSDKRGNAIGRVAGALVSVLLVVTVAGPGAAHADPLNTEPGAGAEVALSWRALGLPGEVTLVGANTNQDFTVPVQSGFSPQRLRGLIHAPVDFAAGFVEITDSGGTLLATVDLPQVTPGRRWCRSTSTSPRRRSAMMRSDCLSPCGNPCAPPSCAAGSGSR